MSYAGFASDDAVPFDTRRLSRGPSPAAVVGTAAVAFGVLTGAWFLADAPARLLRHAAGHPAPLATASASLPRAVAVPRIAVERRVAISTAAPSPFEVALLDPAYSLGPAPSSLAASAPLARDFVWRTPSPAAVPPGPPSIPTAPLAVASVPLAPVAAIPLPPTPLAVEVVPLPTPRPPERGMANRTLLRPPVRQMASRASAPIVNPAPADGGGFLEKFFGLLKPTGPALGYAAPEDSILNRGRAMSAVPGFGYDQYTAVYDISAHTVFMPDGTRLEAHSGLGARLDDPGHVHERNVGATPPHVYDLQLREQPFHGVQALRLNPVGGGGVFGRTGLLAHTFMLGPRGDSNGCVSFRDYRAFLQAYQAGQVRRLVVVARSA